MAIIDRVFQLIENLDISQKEFCLKTGLAPSTISNAKKRNSDISVGNAVLIIQAYPDLDLYWLLLGVGEMWRKPATTSQQNIVNGNGNIAHQSISDCSEQLQAKDLEIAKLKGQIELLKELLNNR